jgi:endonuclease/exonuclease/phosphatase family metal-dependent hydrolase
MSLVVRTWNVYHGRSVPPGRRMHLRRMVDLVTGDRPDLVALQEVPVWAVGRLEGWSGMTARAVVTVPPLLPGVLARVVTSLAPERLRSLVTGQANVLLAGSRLRLGVGRAFLLNPGHRRFDWLRGRGQQRWCHAQEVSAGDGPAFVVANLHASHPPRQAGAEIARAVAFLAGAERCVLAGDFNISAPRLKGFSEPIAGIDQILVRGLEYDNPPRAWKRDRRRVDGVLLSDHPVVEASVA